jgi:serine protease Do
MPWEGFGEIAEKLRRSTVHISSERRGHGSGVIVKQDGVIVTNAHVAVSGALDVQLWDGTRAKSDLLARDSRRDLAILRIAKHDLPAVTLADSDRLRVGELVIAVGNPLGFIGALTTGVVHGMGRVPGLGGREWIQADAQLAPGNSGGPLANAQGQVVGINTMIANGLGLAIPSNAVSRLLRGAASPPRLGVTIRPVSIKVEGKPRVGLILLEIAKGSAAEAASFLPGDILIGADGRKLESIDDFGRALGDSGERLVRLQFLRGDRNSTRTVAVRLGYPDTAAA